MRAQLAKIYKKFYIKRLMTGKNNNMQKCFGISTHLTEEEKFALYQVTRKACHKKQKLNVVEIGSYLGASSSFFAAAIKSHKRSNGKVYCIDTWNNDGMTEGNRDTYKEFKDNTSEFQDIIKPIRGWSTEVVGHVRKSLSGEKIDVLFIDGGHDYDSVKKDWDTYAPLLSSTAIIICHDIGWAEGVQKVVREDIMDKASEIKKLPNMWIGKLGGGDKRSFDLPPWSERKDL